MVSICKNQKEKNFYKQNSKMANLGAMIFAEQRTLANDLLYENLEDPLREHLKDPLCEHLEILLCEHIQLGNFNNWNYFVFFMKKGAFMHCTQNYCNSVEILTNEET